MTTGYFNRNIYMWVKQKPDMLANKNSRQDITSSVHRNVVFKRCKFRNSTSRCYLHYITCLVLDNNLISNGWEHNGTVDEFESIDALDWVTILLIYYTIRDTFLYISFPSLHATLSIKSVVCLTTRWAGNEDALGTNKRNEPDSRFTDSRNRKGRSREFIWTLLGWN